MATAVVYARPIAECIGDVARELRLCSCILDAQSLMPARQSLSHGLEEVAEDRVAEARTCLKRRAFLQYVLCLVENSQERYYDWVLCGLGVLHRSDGLVADRVGKVKDEADNQVMCG